MMSTGSISDCGGFILGQWSAIRLKSSGLTLNLMLFQAGAFKECWGPWKDPVYTEGGLPQDSPRGTDMSIISEPPRVSDWQTGCSPPLTTSPFPSYFQDKASLFGLPPHSVSQENIYQPVSEPADGTVNVKSGGVCIYRLSVSQASYQVNTESVCVFTCLNCWGSINTQHPACWVVRWQAHSQKKQTRLCISVCAIVNEFFWSELKIRTTGGLFELSTFAFKPLLLFSISPSRCEHGCALRRVR